MRKLIALSIIALVVLGFGFGGGGQAAGGWHSRAIYDSLLSGQITGAADTVKLIDWQLSPGGQLVVQLLGYSVANSGTAPNVTFKYRLREKDGEYSWATCIHALNGSAVASPPTAINSSVANYFVVGYTGVGLITGIPTTVGSEIYMIVTKNNWTTGSIDAWSYWKQD